MFDSRLIKFFLFPVLALFYCEIFNYYLVIGQCAWPLFQNKNDETDSNLVKALLMADPHLLGPYRGHWFDKLRREWQMHRAFQSAIYLHKPEVVFILGDLFDEGQWCNDRQFEEYVTRFFSLFDLPSSIKLYVVPGNHDIGFHYSLHPFRVKKFEKTFNLTSVELIEIKKTNFILINSMAMEGDDCLFCYHARKKILNLAGDMKCLKRNQTKCSLKTNLKSYSRPIILQHFPMYRESDAVCRERDEAPPEIKKNLFREKWDCLSKEASEMIYNELNPRLIITGHVHHGCYVLHRADIHEYTLSSFSWRNKNNPTFMLAKFTPNNFVIEKCDMPKESTVIYTYVCAIVSTILWFVLPVLRK